VSRVKPKVGLFYSPQPLTGGPPPEAATGHAAGEVVSSWRGDKKMKIHFHFGFNPIKNEEEKTFRDQSSVNLLSIAFPQRPDAFLVQLKLNCRTHV